MDCSLPGSSVHGFSRQEYWSGVPSPSPTAIFKMDNDKVLLCTQDILLNGMWQAGWEGSLGENGHSYMCG